MVILLNSLLSDLLSLCLSLACVCTGLAPSSLSQQVSSFSEPLGTDLWASYLCFRRSLAPPDQAAFLCWGSEVRCSGPKESEVPVSAGRGSAHASLAKKKKRKIGSWVDVVHCTRAQMNLTGNMWKLTLELEQSNTAKCKVLSSQPRKFSAEKKANPLLRVFILSCLCCYEAIKYASDLRIPDFPTKGEERELLWRELPYNAASIGEWRIGLTEANCQARWFPETKSQLPHFSVLLYRERPPCRAALLCSVGGKAHASSSAQTISDCLDSTVLEASLLCVPFQSTLSP